MVGDPNAPAVVKANGTTTTIVQMRATDNAGNVSAWTSAVSSAANTAKLDNAGPTVPAVTGGSSNWATGSVTFTASASTDAGSGFNHYEYETSTDAGATWSAPTTGPSKTVSTDGTTWITFRAVDALGNKGPWSTDPVAGPRPRARSRGSTTPSRPSPSPAARRLVERRLGDDHARRRRRNQRRQRRLPISTRPRTTVARPGSRP